MSEVSTLRRRIARDVVNQRWLPGELNKVLCDDLLNPDNRFLVLGEELSVLLRPWDDGLLTLGLRVNGQKHWEPYPWYAHICSESMEFKAIPGFEDISETFRLKLFEFYMSMKELLVDEENTEGD